MEKAMPRLTNDRSAENNLSFLHLASISSLSDTSRIVGDVKTSADIADERRKAIAKADQKAEQYLQRGK